MPERELDAWRLGKAELLLVSRGVVIEHHADRREAAQGVNAGQSGGWQWR